MIIGNHIRLRAVEKSDLPLFVRWLNDREVYQTLLVRSPLSLAGEEKWYERHLARPAESRTMVIEVELETGWTPIGTVGFHDIDWTNRSAEFGIMIGEKSQWNRGWGRKAVRLLLYQGFANLNLHRIYLYVHATNERAIHAYKAAGFTLEGTLRQDIFAEGRYIDALLMGILRSEWQPEEDIC